MTKGGDIGYKIKATVTGAKGVCSTGHKVGDTFEISCYDSGGLCGFFYHQIFPGLQTMQFGGKLPWWQGNMAHFQCSDPQNEVTIRLDRSER